MLSRLARIPDVVDPARRGRDQGVGAQVRVIVETAPEQHFPPRSEARLWPAAARLAWPIRAILLDSKLMLSRTALPTFVLLLVTAACGDDTPPPESKGGGGNVAGSAGSQAGTPATGGAGSGGAGSGGAGSGGTAGTSAGTAPTGGTAGQGGTSGGAGLAG